MRGQPPIPKVASALPAPACSGHWATGERSMSPNKVPKKAGRRRSRPTVTADASDIFGPGAEVVGSIRAVFGPLISDIFSVPLILPEVPTWYAFSIPVNTKLEGGARSPATVLGLWENVMKSSNPRTESNLEHGNESAGGGLTSPG
ncbi:uncharacterized protein CLUP02_15115 [Colletotrichum lupini]|uniref:Uncharacterized protein n=1 Tax=Colletotrichum lupini TaxID=145971 RepID=A0A9Q8T5F9_9PEZI|nr:uncharacterized protein CLUP02_15115 [Colletotrichum lupini]UQC89584.1 hypothetical protein CLUP02_15115 [Colletotrichum lupini]